MMNLEIEHSESRELDRLLDEYLSMTDEEREAFDNDDNAVAMVYPTFVRVYAGYKAYLKEHYAGR